jgi:hypothetical protein
MRNSAIRNGNSNGYQLAKIISSSLMAWRYQQLIISASYNGSNG